MSAKRKLCSAFMCICALLLLRSLSALPQGDVRPSIQDPDEYAVLSAVLNSHWHSKIKELVINEEAVNKKEEPFIGFVGGFTFTGAKRPQTAADTASDFEAKGEKPAFFRKQFDLKIPYVLVSNHQLHDIFTVDASGRATSDGWTRFYKLYPESSGIFAFSRVGFNAKRDEALVWVANQSGLLGGTRTFFVLSKRGTSWRIVQTVLMGLS